MNRLGVALACLAALVSPPWTAEAADDFADMRGANYVPSYARNDVQTWLDYDPAVIDRELGSEQLISPFRPLATWRWELAEFPRFVEN